MYPLLLIPTVLGAAPLERVLPANFLQQIDGIRTFVVEELRTARRFLRAAGYQHPFEEVQFFVLNEHTPASEVDAFLNDIHNGPIGLLSEAGVPCVADPGALLVALAHRRSIPVHPLVGPSSILLALMGSGLNGQNFAFNGYLPVKPVERKQKIRELEQMLVQSGQTQIFIETPYRNLALLDALASCCRPDTLVCVAANLSLDDENIQTRPAREWKKNIPDIHKHNAVFLIGSTPF